MRLPKLYAIVDRGTLDAHGIGVRAFAEELRDGGARLMQYRDKVNGAEEVLRAAGELDAVFAGTGALLVMNDFAGLAAELGWGCHVGQEDMSVKDARSIVGAGVLGVSTHSEAQVLASVLVPPMSENPDMGHPVADATQCSPGPDYVAIGPVFGTLTKLDAEPVVGLEGVRMTRALTTLPLVAIGGIGKENARSVMEAGADSVAVISALLPRGGMSTRQRVEEMIALLA